jgi:phosphoserine phosphatase
LEFRDGKLTGVVTGEIVDGARKAELLREIAAREGIRLEQVIAVGRRRERSADARDRGSRDRLSRQPIVTRQARHAIASVGLDGILYLLGMRDRDLERLARGRDREDAPSAAA